MDSGIQLLSPPPATPALRRALLYCLDAHPTYARNFADAGISRADILLLDDPIAILRRLPIIGADAVNALSGEAVSAARSIVDTEISSGSAGGQKTRFMTHADNVAEHEFLAYLLSVAGIGAGDRVACVDTDPAAVMVSFPRACELLGARESYCVSVGADFEDCARLLAQIQPTALISVPSIIQRLLGAMRAHPVRSISKVVYIGEGMSPRTRAVVENDLGAEVFSYYGASETSAIGIECRAHTGVHLMSSRHLLELDTQGHDGDNMGDLIVTTLEQRGLPLLRYRLGDLVRVRPGRCACGLNDPRVDVLGRSEMFASILGSKIHHGALLGSLQRVGLDGPLQATLTTESGKDVMTLRVSDANRAAQDAMLNAIVTDHADIEFLVDSGLLDLRFAFAPISELLNERKANSLTDLRDHFQTPSPSMGEGRDGGERGGDAP